MPTFRWRPGKLARSGSSLLVWMGLRAAIQAAIVVLLARELGAKPYGQFVAVIAVASFFTPFVGIGMANLVLRNGARDPNQLSAYLSRALHWWRYSLVPAATLAVVLASLLLPRGLSHLATCAAILAELIASSLTELRARHQQAQQHINAYGAINAGLPTCRLIALVALFLTQTSASTTAVLWTYAASSITYAVTIWVVQRPTRDATVTRLVEPMTLRDGLPFSLAGFAIKLQGEFNKPILARVSANFAGTYNVAQRAVDLISLPLTALQESLWPRLYAQPDPTWQLRRTGAALLALAFALGIVVWIAAPVIPIIFGTSFTAAVSVIRWLAWLPVLQVFRYLVNFYVIHRTWMTLIGWTYAFGALANVILVATLVPHAGMGGAIIAAYLTELTMTVTLLAGCAWKYRR